jgi:hypothetical protein
MNTVVFVQAGKGNKLTKTTTQQLYTNLINTPPYSNIL